MLIGDVYSPGYVMPIALSSKVVLWRDVFGIVYLIGVGILLLLVQLGRAMREASECGTSNRIRLSRLNRNILYINLIYNYQMPSCHIFDTVKFPQNAFK